MKSKPAWKGCKSVQNTLFRSNCYGWWEKVGLSWTAVTACERSFASLRACPEFVEGMTRPSFLGGLVRLHVHSTWPREAPSKGALS